MAKKKKKQHEGNLPHLVVKDNRLMEAKFHFSLWEMRIFERMVSLVEKGDTEFRLCRIYIKDLMDFFYSKSNNDYELVRDAARSLAYKKLHIPYMRDNRRRWAIISVFPTVTTPDSEERGGDNAYIELEFHRDLRPYLLDLKERFKSYDIRNIQSLRSIYSIRLYILLKQYEGLGKRRFSVGDLKEILGIPEDKYTHYGSFKQRVLKRPQQEIAEHCDLYFDYEEEKEGKRVVSLLFHIHTNPDRQYGKEELASGEEQEISLDRPDFLPKFATAATIPAAANAYFGHEQIAEWVRKHGEEAVAHAVGYTMERMKEGKRIANAAAYVQQLLKQPLEVASAPAPATEPKAASKQGKDAVREQKARRAEAQATYEQMMGNYQADLERALNQLASSFPNAIEELKAKALEKARSILTAATEQSQVTQAQLMRLAKERFPDSFAPICEQYEPRLAVLKRHLDLS